MKNVAIIAVILGVLGNAANAESAVETPNMTLALNSNASVAWIKPAAASTKALAKNIELKANKAMETISVDLSKQLEAKIAKELEYAIR